MSADYTFEDSNHRITQQVSLATGVRLFFVVASADSDLGNYIVTNEVNWSRGDQVHWNTPAGPCQFSGSASGTSHIGAHLDAQSGSEWKSRESCSISGFGAITLHCQSHDWSLGKDEYVVVERTI